VNKTNPLIAALDRHAHRIGLKLTERGNVRAFEYGPTRRWLEYRPGGKGVVKVTAYSFRAEWSRPSSTRPSLRWSGLCAALSNQSRRSDQLMGSSWSAFCELDPRDQRGSLCTSTSTPS
jgi:hypothetical protein